jgi:hypothetical protein
VAQIVQQHKDRLEASKSHKKKRELWLLSSDMKPTSKKEPFQRVKESSSKDGNLVFI